MNMRFYKYKKYGSKLLRGLQKSYIKRKNKWISWRKWKWRWKYPNSKWEKSKFFRIWSKKIGEKKTFTENFFGLFEHEKERKSNLKSPSHKNIKKHISKNLINDQLGPNSDFKISNIVNKNSSPKFSDLINNKENNNINYNINYNINNYVNNIPLNKEIEKKEEINKKEGKFEEDKNIIIEKKEDEDIKND